MHVRCASNGDWCSFTLLVCEQVQGERWRPCDGVLCQVVSHGDLHTSGAGMSVWDTGQQLNYIAGGGHGDNRGTSSTNA